MSFVIWIFSASFAPRMKNEKGLMKLAICLIGVIIELTGDFTLKMKNETGGISAAAIPKKVNTTGGEDSWDKIYFNPIMRGYGLGASLTYESNLYVGINLMKF